MGKTAEALAAYKESVSILQRLSEAYPSMPDYHRELGRAYNLIGELHVAAGRHTEAVTSLEQARAIHERLVREHPQVKDFGKGLAASLSELGRALKDSGKPARAEAEYRKALSVARKLVDDNPTVLEFRIRLETTVSDLVYLLAGNGKDQQREGKNAEAEASFRSAAAVMEKLTTLMAANLFDLECAQSLLAGVAAKSGSALSAAEGRVEADRAVDTLRRAVAAGYRDLACVRTDTDLDPLRLRADFQLLMMDLAFPEEPF